MPEQTAPVLAFVGTPTADDQESMRNPAWSAAGCRYQLGLLGGLRDAGIAPELILSQEPARRFPFSRRLLKGPGGAELAPGMHATWIPYLNLPLLRRPTVGWYVMLRLWRWGRVNRKASRRVVIAYNLTEPPAWAVLAGARLARAVSVAVVADLDTPGQTSSRPPRRRLDDWLGRRLIGHFDRLVGTRDDIGLVAGPDRPWLVVPGGVPNWPSAQARARRAEQSVTSYPQFTLAYAGTLNAGNGVPLILGAMEFLEGERFRLRVAGRGPLERMVRDVAARDARVEYCGFLGREGLAAFYEQASLLLDVRQAPGVDYSGYFQGKLLEYLASGRPVLTTANQPAAGPAAEAWFVFEGGGPARLAEVLRGLAEQPPMELSRRAEVGRRFVEEIASWERQGRRIRAFIEDCGG